MTGLFIACLVMNVLDAFGTWIAVGVIKCAFEVNPVVAAVIAHFGWAGMIVLKIVLGTVALSHLYRKRHFKPRAMKAIFIFLTIVFGLLLASQLIAYAIYLLT